MFYCVYGQMSEIKNFYYYYYYYYNSKNIKHYTNSIYQKYNNKYMTPVHQNNLGTELFLSQIQRCYHIRVRC